MHHCVPYRPSQPRRRTGFTFLEVLFAVIVLGIGFIMVAAMFPAAIKQTQASVEDTAASSVWIGLHRKFIELAKNKNTNLAPNAVPTYYLDTNMPMTGTATPGSSKVYSFNDPRMNAAQIKALWGLVSDNIICEADPRYACIPFFRREVDTAVTNPSPLGASTAQLFFVPIHVRNHVEYTSSDVSGGLLNPTLISNVTIDGTTTPPQITLGVVDDSAVGSGAYVIVSDGPIVTLPNSHGSNGQIYRLGARVDPANPSVYYIAPDTQGASDVYAGAKIMNAKVFVVGRGATPTGSPTNFDGPVQDLGAIPATIKLR